MSHTHPISHTQRATSFVLCLMFLPLLACGCGDGTPADTAAARSTAYICTETNEVFAMNGIESPGINPTNGRRTLVTALYCTRCNTWYPAPPFETLQRTPGASLCPKTGTPMNVAGPIPSHR